MLFSEEFIENIREEPIQSIVTAIEKGQNTISENTDFWIEEEYDNLFETYSLVLVIIESFDFKLSFENEITFNGDIQNDCILINNYLNQVHTEFSSAVTLIKLETMKSKFHKKVNQVFAYEFSQGDIDRIQVLINELREEIKKSDFFEEKHKERFLKRLEKLQAEMHKKMSDVDRFWGLIGDAGVVLGKFGKNSKPFVDRIKEISDIVWRTQSRAEELPSNTPAPTVIEAEIIEE